MSRTTFLNNSHYPIFVHIKALSNVCFCRKTPVDLIWILFLSDVHNLEILGDVHSKQHASVFPLCPNRQIG